MAQEDYQADYDGDDVRNITIDFGANLGISIIGCILLIMFVFLMYIIFGRKK